VPLRIQEKERSVITSFSFWRRKNTEEGQEKLQIPSNTSPERKKRVFRGSIKYFRRDSWDLGLLLRKSLLARVFPSILRFCPRGRFSLLKEYVVHAVVLLIVGGVVITNYATAAADRGSMLFKLFGEADIEEGPLNTKALKEGTLSSLAGRNYALAQVPSLSGGISEDDLEFQLANTLDGNALLSSEEPSTSTTPDQKRATTFAYQVKEGDTPSTIAARFGVSTNTILWANGIKDGDVIKTGDILVILPVTGVLHEVEKGEDLSTIAKKYKVKTEEIVAENNLGDSSTLKIGMKLIIPDGYMAPEKRPVVVAEAPDDEPVIDDEPEPSTEPTATPKPGKQLAGYLWPTSTKRLSQYFGWSHTGIDIPNRNLPPITAAKNGKVAYSGWLGGYGNLVILDHGNNVKTYYAHMSKIYVKSGQAVTQGQTLGKMGSTGRSTGPHLHFEVRVNGRPTNPLNYF